ncbi:YbeD family protein [Alkanindiges sp. WGS2144]|uniref:YbeD family protein n=1 Tax=Alkanindiges sp. WGS2144 TaxID=3366808 RepID=UPI0037518406
MNDNQPISLEEKPLNETLWQFPMDYPIHLIGYAVPELRDEVEAILLKHFPWFDTSTIVVQPSSKGTYESLRAQLRFDNMDQVHALYADLKACPHIKTAL